MDAYKVLLALTAYSSLILGFLILRKSPVKPAHWVFFAKSLIVAVFALLAMAIQYARSESEALRWHKLYILAMHAQPIAFFLFYSLVIPASRWGKILRRILVTWFAVIVVIWANVPSDHYCGYERIQGLWMITRQYSTPLINLQVIYITIVPLCLFTYILIWHLKCRTNKEKHHSRLVLCALLTVYILSFGTDCLQIRFIVLPHVTPILFFIYLATVYYAHTHYYFLDNELGTYLEDMLDNSSDMFIFLNEALEIKKVNRAVLDRMGMDRSSIVGKPFEPLILDSEDIETLRSLSRKNAADVNRKVTTLRFKIGEDSLTVKASINRVQDRFGDFIGIYIFAQTMKELEAFRTSHGVTPKQMEIFSLLLKGLTSAEISEKLFISRRTVETHIAALYMRLNVNSKVELLHLANDFGLM